MRLRVGRSSVPAGRGERQVPLQLRDGAAVSGEAGG
jgi:hypothetical protein